MADNKLVWELDKKNINANEKYLPVVLQFGSNSGVLNKDTTEIFDTLVGGIDSYTKLMIQSDTTDGDTDFVDSSDSEHVVTANGSVHHEEDEHQFGVTSIHFNGTTDYLTIPYSSAFDIGTSDFTIDYWMCPTDATANFDVPFDLRQTGGSTPALVIIYIGSSQTVSFYVQSGTPITFNFPTIVNDTWYHVAFVRSSGIVTCYVDGVATEAGISATGSISTTLGCKIGAEVNLTAGYFFNGYLDEFRISNGIARWTSNFTPPEQSYVRSWSKLKITDQDNNRLFSEVEHWDDTNKKATLHCKLHDIYSSYGTTVTVDFNPSNIDQRFRSLVEASDSFNGVAGEEIEGENWRPIVYGANIPTLTYARYMGDGTVKFYIAGNSTNTNEYSYQLQTFSVRGDIEIEVVISSEYGANDSGGGQIGVRLLSSSEVFYMNYYNWNRTQYTVGRLGDTASTFDTATYAPSRFKFIKMQNGVWELWTKVDTADYVKSLEGTGAADEWYTFEFYGFERSNSYKYIIVPDLLYTSGIVSGFIGLPGSEPAKEVWDKYFAFVSHQAQDPSVDAPQIVDSTYNANHGTSYGTMLTEDLIDADVGKALDYDGTDDYTNHGYDEVHDITDTLTLEVSFTPNTLLDSSLSYAQGLLDRSYDPTDAEDSYGLYINDLGLLQVSTMGGNIQSTKASWAADQNFIVASTYNSTGLVGDLFVDGIKEILSTDSYDVIVGSLNSLVIGKRADINTFFPGSISEVRISNIVRSDNWIEMTNLSLTDNLFIVNDYYAQLYEVIKIATDPADIGSTLTNYPLTLKIDAESGVTDFNTKHLFDTVGGQIDEYVSFLMRSNGAHGSTAFVDIINPERVITSYASPWHSKTQTVFQDTSMRFDGVSDYLQTPIDSSLEFGFEDFTVDFWWYFDRTTWYNEGCFRLGPSGKFQIFTYSSYGGLTLRVWPLTVAVNHSFTGETFQTWTHVAVSRQNDIWYMFINGVLCKSFVMANYDMSLIGDMSIGTYSGSTYAFRGYLDEIRISKGICRWKEDFDVPPSPYMEGWKSLNLTLGDDKLYSEVELWDERNKKLVLHTNIPSISDTVETLPRLNFEFPNIDRSVDSSADPETKLLIHAGEGNASTDISDSSDSNHTITANGNAAVKSFNADQNSIVNYSGFFNGTDAYLTIPDSADFTFGTNNFTIEFWIRRNGTGFSRFLGQCNSASDNNTASVRAHFHSDDKLSFRMCQGTSTYYTDTTTVFNDDKWHHIAAVRDGNDFTIFVDGIVDNVTDVTGVTVNDSTYSLTIGRLGDYNTELFNGYISGFAIHTGVVLYTIDFTPPRIISQMTNDSNTVLFLDFTELTQGLTPSTIIDSSASAHTVTNASSKVSGCTFWWNGAIEFDGTGDYLSHSPIDLGTDSFTVSAWVVADFSVGGDQRIYSTRNASGTAGIDFLISSASGGLRMILDDGPNIYSTIIATESILDGAFHHVACVVDRVADVIRYYIDGNQYTTGTISAVTGSLTSPDDSQIGKQVGGSDYWKGFIAELRVSKSKIYTATFIPPTQPHESGFIGLTGSFAAKKVWDANFSAVYHMSQDPSGGTDSIIDSTSNFKHGTPIAMDSANLVDGLIGKGITFNGTDEAIGLGDTFDDILIGSSATISVEASIELDSGFGASIFFSKYHSTSNNRGILFRVLDVSFSRMSNHYEGVLSGNYRDYGGDSTIIAGSQILTWTYDAIETGNSGKDRVGMFIDGVEDTPYADLYVAGSQTDIANNAAHAGIGATLNTSGVADGANFLKGTIFEYRLSNIVRSDDWIAVTNLSLTDSLLTYEYSGTTYLRNFSIQNYNLFNYFTRNFIAITYHIVDQIIRNYSDQRWSYRFTSSLIQYYGDTPQLRAVLTQWLLDCRTARNALEILYGSNQLPRNFINQPYAISRDLLQKLEQLYIVTQATPVNFINQPYAIKSIEEVKAQMDQLYTIFPDSLPLEASPEVTVSINGVVMPFINMNLEYAQGSYAGSCSITLAQFGEWLTVSYEQAVIITVEGQEYHMIVLSKSRQESVKTESLVVEAKSQAVLLDFPFATEVGEDFEVSGTESEIVSALAALEGLSIVWGLPVNDNLTSNEIQVVGRSPLECIKEIVNALGGILQSHPDGTIHAVLRYVVDSDKYDAETPVIIYTSGEDFINLSDETDKRDGYNKYFVTNLTLDDGYTLDSEEISPSHYELKAYKVPWTTQAVTLTTSELTNVIITSLNEQTETLTEEIEIVEGAGSVSKPCYGLTESPNYKTSVDLGSVTVLEDGTVKTFIKGNTLVELTYTTKFWMWDATNIDEEDVQFILETA